eukprot:COSAG02_NODE_1362_length_13050_cov_22.164775_3_plen_72_part_00
MWTKKNGWGGVTFQTPAAPCSSTGLVKSGACARRIVSAGLYWNSLPFLTLTAEPRGPPALQHREFSLRNAG